MLNKRLIVYSAITVFCGIFSAVYEYFSHGVYSDFMIYLFAIPLIFGVVPSLLGLVVPRLRVASNWSKLLQDFGIATLAVGATLQGVIEIYGTDNPHISYYFGIGCVFLTLSLVLWTIEVVRHRHTA